MTTTTTRDASRDFRPATTGVEYTFADGKIAVLRPTLPKWELVRSGRLDGELVAQLAALEQTGAVTDPKRAVELLDVIVTAMWVEPRVVTDAAAVDYEGTPQVVHVSDIEGYIDETLEVAFRGTRAAQSFRADGSGPGGGDGGADVADDAEPDDGVPVGLV